MYEDKRYSDFAILIRINALSRVFEEELRRYNISYVVWGGFKFYERAEVKQALSYLKLLVNPCDEVAFSAAMSFPKRGVGEATIQKIGKYTIMRDVTADGGNGFRSLELRLAAKTLDGLENFISVMQKLEKLNAEEGLEGLAKNFLSVTGLSKAYKTGREDDERRIENLFELENAISQFAKDNPEATLSQYLQSVTINMGDEEDKGDKVIISTIHSAKGLEFKHVFVAGLEDGIFPLDRAKQSPDEMEEERRLLYVAITRAKEGLTLSNVGSRFYRGSRQWMRPSLFLKDIGYENERDEEPEDNRSFSTATSEWRARGSSGQTAWARGAFGPGKKGYRQFDTQNENDGGRKVSAASYSVGEQVKHPVFGEGEVEAIIDNGIVKVRFENVGVKMLSVQFANLEKL